jgi:hypothetical protein
MATYDLSVAHTPSPHNLPVGYVATSANAAQVRAAVEQGGQFSARAYPSADKLTETVKAKLIYGGIDVTSRPPALYVASAAGTSASNTLRAAFTAVAQQQLAQEVKKLVASGQPVPAAMVA